MNIDKKEELHENNYIFPVNERVIDEEYMKENNIESIRVYDYEKLLRFGLCADHDSYSDYMFKYFRYTSVNSEGIYPYGTVYTRENDRQLLAKYENVVVVLVQRKEIII